MKSDTIDSLAAAAYRFPLDEPESDGTLEWSATTMAVVHVRSGDAVGMGYTYAPAAAATLVRDEFTELLCGRDAHDVVACSGAMWQRVRNHGKCGLAAMAISAVDIALWDLRGHLLGMPLATLFGAAVREAVPAYASGGFTSRGPGELFDEAAHHRSEGFMRHKMKIGRHPGEDARRVEAFSEGAGEGAEIFVDANEAYKVHEAIEWAHRLCGQHGVCWLEQPVDHSDVAGLRHVRAHLPAGLALADGEYCWSPADFRRLAQQQTADVLMADVTRCGGFTGLIRCAAIAESASLTLSTHCAPALSAAAAAALPGIGLVEDFEDHRGVESQVLRPEIRRSGGALHPPTGSPGHGLTFAKEQAPPPL